MRTLVIVPLIIGMMLNVALAEDFDSEKQQKELGQACLKEAENVSRDTSYWKWKMRGWHHERDPRVEKMQALCRQMTDAYFSHDEEKHSSLAQECSDRIAEESKVDPKNTEHFQKLRNICSTMTGVKIP